MERLFSPCTRMHDILESHGRGIRTLLLELHLDVSTEEFLSGVYIHKHVRHVRKRRYSSVVDTPRMCRARSLERGALL
jgi:hypothetical protein